MTTQTDAIKLAIEALEIGLDCAQEIAAQVHGQYKGYKPQRHATVDADVAQIEAALAALQEQVQAREGEAVTVSNEEAHALAEEWNGQAGGRLAPQLTDNEVAGMLAQFATNRTKDWPKWMQDNARVATASFPKRAAPQPAQPAYGAMVAEMDMNDRVLEAIDCETSQQLEQGERKSIELERWGRSENLCLRLLDRMDDGYWTPWHIAAEAIAGLEEHITALQSAQPVAQQELDKAALIGEFTFDIDDTCSACAYHEPDDDCEVCGGEVQYKRTVTVPWTTIKEIHRTILKSSQPVAQPLPLTSCNCFDDTARRLCRNNGKCTKIEAHGIKA